MRSGLCPQAPSARIGPNSITQLVAVLDSQEGRALRDAVMEHAGVAVPDPARGMIPERDAAAVHDAVREMLPLRSDRLLRLAGLATGRYILDHRIPALAQHVIRRLPASIGGRVLSVAISKHAWTFVGSGAFRVTSRRPLTFEIRANPLSAVGQAQTAACHWHVAVFEMLFSDLVWKGCLVRETSCCVTGAAACTFVVSPRASPGGGRKPRLTGKFCASDRSLSEKVDTFGGDPLPDSSM